MDLFLLYVNSTHTKVILRGALHQVPIQWVSRIRHQSERCQENTPRNHDNSVHVDRVEYRVGS